MRAVNFEMCEQAFALRHIIRPGDALHPAARLTTFPPVENDACVMLWQMIKQPDAGVDALRRPLVDARIESRRCIHQQRRSRSDHFVTCCNPVDFSEGHDYL